MGNVVDSVLERFTNEIMSLADIAEEETHSLNKLMMSLVNVRTLFVVKGVQADIARHCGKFVKFWKITELLELPLTDISSNFRTGNYQEFTPREMKNIVMSLFSDSPKRRELILNINKQIS